MNRTWPALTDSVPEICRWVHDRAREAGFPDGEAQRWELAAEEVAINIARYAYAEGPPGTIGVEASPSTDQLTVTFIDDGRAFNPVAVPDPDIEAPLEERKIGGLGIYLTRKMVDRIRYERRDGKNILTLSKRLPS